MQLSDWDQRWTEGRIGFHQQDVSDFLTKYADRVWGEASTSRVLVPLCGKSLDMVFLAERSDAVVGVEFVTQAVEEFFDEQDLTPTVDVEDGRKYTANSYTLFAADFFEVSTQDIGPVDAVFDRASLVALDNETRVRYADYLGTLQQPGATTMLITFDYNQSEMNGPPFAVSDAEVAQLFTEEFAIEHLETRNVMNEMFTRAGLTVMTESVFKLTKL